MTLPGVNSLYSTPKPDIYSVLDTMDNGDKPIAPGAIVEPLYTGEPSQKESPSPFLFVLFVICIVAAIILGVTCLAPVAIPLLVICGGALLFGGDAIYRSSKQSSSAGLTPQNKA